jgi:hypothetical protein
MAIEMEKLTRNISNTMWWGILASLHGHILMSCLLWMISLQRKSKTWKLLIGSSMGGTTRMLHPPTTFRGSHWGHCGQILHDLFFMELCARYAKMILVQREAWPWGHVNAFITLCAWLAYSWFVDFVPSLGLPSTNACISFLGLLHTCHQAGRRILKFS